MKYKLLDPKMPYGAVREMINELEDEAIDNYLNDTEFDAIEWLDTEEDKMKYCELRNMDGIIDFCECGNHEFLSTGEEII